MAIGRSRSACARVCGLWGAGLLLLTAAPLARGQAQERPAVSSDAAPAPLVFERVTVVDVEHGTLRPDQRVMIAGNRIRTVVPSGATPLPAGAHVVDARGKYLIPGLWDMHVHPGFPDYAFPLLLANGITGMRDASVWLLDSAMQWRREAMAGTRFGPPRQILSYRVYGAGPLCNGVAPCVTGPVRARQLVDSLKAVGADMVKMYEFGSRDLYLAVAAAARRAKIPFGGHLAAGSLTPIEAANSGASLIDHVADFSAPAGSLGPVCVFPSATLAQCRPVAAAFHWHETWWVPTLTVMGAVRKGFPNLYEVPYQPAADTIATHFLDIFAKRFQEILYPRDSIADSTVLNHRYALDSVSVAMLRARPARPADSVGMLRLFRRLGLPLLAGTDANPGLFLPVPAGFALHVELALYVAEGLTPLEALQTATLNPAKFLHATDSLGTVAAGKLADLVLLDADPLADITNIQQIRAVVANGRYYDRAALDGQLLAAHRAVKHIDGQALSDLGLQYGPNLPVLLRP